LLEELFDRVSLGVSSEILADDGRGLNVLDRVLFPHQKTSIFLFEKTYFMDFLFFLGLTIFLSLKSFRLEPECKLLGVNRIQTIVFVDG
jgi:hypothetical protein